MCIIALTKKGNTEITLEEFKSMSRSNNDGVGIMYRENWTVKIEKFLGKTECSDAYNYYQSLLTKEGVDDICIHFRLATHGNVNLENTHPFPFKADGYFVHNGLLPLHDRQKSDTHLLSDMMMSLSENPLKNEDFRAYLKSISGWSRFVFMDSEETIWLGQSIEHNGNFFSNYGYGAWRTY